MDISCFVLVEGKFESVVIPEKLLIKLCQSLKNNGIETVHLADRSMQVEGVYVTAKGFRKILCVL